ncbi:uncharacterized protein LOC125776718 [Bactrocera dorsalis]|uniref:Uncharacterized protein LOC125776718 n=1 Tax=Bactrocera dorsalis TaxID=27457 RepID=A0ABM3JAF3_BACDO|nr:uncharacterized protein LOC125776718 [Bactrocera dorsalis]
MPQTSEKQKLVNFIIEEAASNILLHLDDDNSYWKTMDELDESLAIILSNHRGNYQNVPKCLEWRTNVLDYLDEGRYQQMLRVSRDQFALLLSLIKDSAQFNNAQSIRQFSVEMQLAITLYRLGSSGESAAIRKVATLFGVGDGETLYKITKRVFSSILELKSRYITCPDTSERQNIVKTTYNELPHCIGYIDGTELKLAEAPVVNHSAYFSKSRIYSIKAQVVCD